MLISKIKPLVTMGSIQPLTIVANSSIFDVGRCPGSMSNYSDFRYLFKLAVRKIKKMILISTADKNMQYFH